MGLNEFKVIQKPIPKLIDFDRFLELKSFHNRSQIHQTPIPKSMLFSIPFSDRFLIDFRSLQTLKMLIFHCRGAHFHEIAVSRKLSKNHQNLIQKTSRNQSKNIGFHRFGDPQAANIKESPYVFHVFGCPWAPRT